MKVFLDTNVICDFLLGREPYFAEAASIMQMIENNDIKGYMSALSIGQIYYIYRKVYSHDYAIKKIGSLIEVLQVCSIERKTIEMALLSHFNDFEDALQYSSVHSGRSADVIITRNIKDFKNSDIPVLTPKTFLTLKSSTDSPT